MAQEQTITSKAWRFGGKTIIRIFRLQIKSYIAVNVHAYHISIYQKHEWKNMVCKTPANHFFEKKNK